MSSENEESLETGESDEDDDEDLKINWSESMIQPEPYLITEEKFDLYSDQLSFKDYFQTFSTLIESSRKWPARNGSSKLQDKGNIKSKLKRSNSSLDCANTHVEDELEGKSLAMQEKRSRLEDSIISPREQKRESDIFENVNEKEKWTSISHLQPKKTHYHELLPQPRFTSIGPRNLKFYKWYSKVKSKRNQLTKSDTNKIKFTELTENILAEQREYQEFLSKAALANPQEYVYVNPMIVHNLKQHTLKAIEKVLSENKVQLKAELTWDLSKLTSSNEEDSTKASFEFVKCLQEQVQKPSLVLPPVETPLTPDCRFLINHTRDKIVTAHTDIKELLFKEHGHIFITQPTFLAIMENLAVHPSELLLPFKVEEIDKGNSTWKVILFDQPLPPRSITSRETSCIYYKSKLVEELHIDTCDGNSVSLNLFRSIDLGIIVEAAVDAYSNQTMSCQVNPKIEFQPSIGMEKYSLLDICRSWWDSMIANTDYACPVRIDPRNDIILHYEKFTRSEICSPGCPYKPEIYMHQFYVICEKLRNLPSDRYLVEFSLAENSVKTLGVHKYSEESESLLEKWYKGVTSGHEEFVKDKVFSWLPIDMNILPKHCLNNAGIPWLFHSMPRKLKGKREAKKKKNIEFVTDTVEFF